jgi:uncharacterized protein
MTTTPADALVVNIAGLLGEPPGAHRDILVDGVLVDLGVDLVQASPLEVRARIARTNRGVILTGHVRTSLAETCSRCLVAIEVPLDVPVDEEVLPSIDLGSGLPVDTNADPEAHRLSDHHELDLEPLAREAILLAAPIAPVCRVDCRGLCPECGADLNAGPHDHGEAPIDPRLAKLLDFKVDE